MYYKIVSYIRADDEDALFERFDSLASAEQEVMSLTLMHGDDCIFVVESTDESVE